MQNPTDNERDDAWLLTGDESDPRVKPGELRARSKFEEQMLRLFRTLPSEHHAMILAGIEAMAEAPAKPIPHDSTEADADLIALCARFDALENAQRAMLDSLPRGHGLEAERVCDAARQPLLDEQARLLAQIAEAQATTLRGHQTRARTFLNWDRGVTLTRDGYWNSEFVFAIIRDLAAER